MMKARLIFILDAVLSHSISSGLLWLFWTYMGMGERFFFFIPLQFQTISFLDFFGLLVFTQTLRNLIGGRNV